MKPDSVFRRGEGVPPLRLAGILPVEKEQGQDALATSRATVGR